MNINKPAVIIILIIIIGISVWLFVWPKYSEFSDIKVALAKKQAEYDGESQYYEKVAQVIKDIEVRKDILDKIDSSLSADPAIAPLLYFFQKKAAETGMIIRSVTYANSLPVAPPPTADGTVPEKKVKDVTFSINLVGNYQGLKSFLFGLEKSARLLEVDTLNLTPFQSAQGSSQSLGRFQTYEFRLQVRTHIY